MEKEAGQFPPFLLNYVNNGIQKKTIALFSLVIN